MTKKWRNAREVFDGWALDHHAEGMEKSHRRSVEQAFRLIPPSDGDYLEIGIGNGYAIHHMAVNQYRRGRCFGLDISPNMVARAAERTRSLANVRIEAADFRHWMPPPETAFTCIFSMETFYYFEDIAAGIEKAVSLLCPSGILMILVNHYHENEASHSWPEDLSTPMTLWKAEQYLEAFEESGLRDLRQMRLQDGEQAAGTLCTAGTKPPEAVS
ncbi:MAG TPA: class I SAM-dependent methyltransferase [bacterium]|nr:class I SAM-dependent methyltransferase [bacterium]